MCSLLLPFLPLLAFCFVALLRARLVFSSATLRSTKQKNWTRRVCGTGTTVQARVYTLSMFNATRQSGGFVKQFRTLVKAYRWAKLRKPCCNGLNSMLKSAFGWGLEGNIAVIQRGKSGWTVSWISWNILLRRVWAKVLWKLGRWKLKRVRTSQWECQRNQPCNATCGLRQPRPHHASYPWTK